MKQYFSTSRNTFPILPTSVGSGLIFLCSRRLFLFGVGHISDGAMVGAIGFAGFRRDTAKPEIFFSGLTFGP